MKNLLHRLDQSAHVRRVVEWLQRRLDRVRFEFIETRNLK